ncbi:MAG: DUF494 family protein [bacterium]|nr:DUF494 family protein [bacterium]
MGNRVLEIVVYLIDHMRENQGMLPSMDDLTPDLQSMGYSDTEISSAYSWVIDRFEHSDEPFFAQFPEEHHSNRVLTQYERLQLSPEAYGFLVKLVALSVIDDEQFETVLERAFSVSPQRVDLEQIKLVTAAVLFNELNEMESLALFDPKIDPTLTIN